MIRPFVYYISCDIVVSFDQITLKMIIEIYIAREILTLLNEYE